jgi:hypothetical protein
MSRQFLPALVTALALAACSGGGGPPAGTGATTGSGGATSGGAATTGGSASGGAATTGGSASGGAATTGGATSNGGTPVSGGASSGGASSGGATTTGGSVSGGVSSTSGGSGGNSASGGAMSSGGKAASGGSGGNLGTSGGRANSGGASDGNSASGGAAGAAAYRPCPTDGSPCKIMPFGDSITDGFGTIGAYRVELFRLAHQAGKNITFVGRESNGPAMVDGVAFPPKHEGHSGFTIAPAGGRSGISPLVSMVMPEFTPHIVTLMIGTNDAIDNYQLENAPTRLGALIDSIFSQLPNVLLVVAQPIPSQEDALNLRIQAYNATIPAVVKARADAGRHILLVDMYTPFTQNAAYKSALLKDTWHPNEAGHALLGARWYAVLSSSL